MKTVEADVVVKAKTERILAIDLIRGFFLLVIMIDHVELFPNGWDFLTGKGRLWVSAAEGFFFLSGLLIGMIYKRRLHLGMKYIFRKMWGRALELYVIGTLLTFLFLGWVELTNHVPIKDTLPNPIPWGYYAWHALTLRFTYGWADFLVHFAALMVIAPFIFFLVAKRKTWLALIIIAAMWLIRGDHFTLAWQLMFNLGIIIGFYWQKIQSYYRKLEPNHKLTLKRSVASLAIATFVISYASIYLLSLLFNMWGANLLPHWLQHVAYDWGNWNFDVWIYADKWTLGWLRIILFFLWFPTLYWIFRRYERQINRLTRGLLEMLGRNSLFVYTCHAFIVFVLRMYFIPPHTGLVMNFLITGIGLALLFMATYAYNSLRARFYHNGASFKGALKSVFSF